MVQLIDKENDGYGNVILIVIRYIIYRKFIVNRVNDMFHTIITFFELGVKQHQMERMKCKGENPSQILAD